MSVEVWGMMIAGIAALVAGLALARTRFNAASGADRILQLGPVFEAAPLAVFSAEHFTAAHDLMPIVPRWLPYPLFWTYFVGVCLLATAISLIVRRHVRWSSSLLALLFLIIVATVDLPNLPRGADNRFFWILTAREISFAGGAMTLAGSVWPVRRRAGAVLMGIGRGIVAFVLTFYGIEHFLFPQFVPGVPLEKPMPVWIPAPTVIAYVVGSTLVITGIALFFRWKIRMVAAGCGSVLLLLTVFFYGSIFAAEIHSRAQSALLVEGLNYIFDTMLFAATVLLAGVGPDKEFTDALVPTPGVKQQDPAALTHP